MDDQNIDKEKTGSEGAPKPHRRQKSKQAKGPLNSLAVSYVRVSTREQRKEGYSIEAQRDRLESFAARSGFQVLKIYEEVESASKLKDRGVLGEVVTFFERQARKPDREKACMRLLAEKPDRLTRNTFDRQVARLLELGVDLIFTDGTVMSSSVNSSKKLEYNMKALMAQHTADNLGEEAKKGLTKKAQLGGWNNRAPLGYMNVSRNGKRVVEPDPETAPLVIKLFELAATGTFSLRELTDWAWSNGLRDPRPVSGSSGVIHQSRIYDTLQRPFYAGWVIWGEVEAKGLHTPLVSEELFEMVQAALRKRGDRRTVREKFSWPYQGLMVCHECGASMVAGAYKNRRYNYVHCSGSKSPHPRKYHDLQKVHKMVGKIMGQIKMDEEIVAWMTATLKDMVEKKNASRALGVQTLRKEYDRLQKCHNRAYVDRLAEKIPESTFIELATNWRKEMEAIQAKLVQMEEENLDFADDAIRVFELAKRAEYLFENANDGERRHLVEIVCSNLEFGPQGLTATFRKPFDLLAQIDVQAGSEGPEEGAEIHELSRRLGR